MGPRAGTHREAERRHRVEEQRRKDLGEQLERWRLAGEIRAFLGEARTTRSLNTDEGVEEWPAWADGYAARLDPLTALPEIAALWQKAEEEPVRRWCSSFRRRIVPPPPWAPAPRSSRPGMENGGLLTPRRQLGLCRPGLLPRRRCRVLLAIARRHHALERHARDLTGERDLRSLGPTFVGRRSHS